MKNFKYLWNYLSSTIVDFKYMLLGYKTYKAFITQSGINAPEAFVIENTLGIALSFSYDSPGIYYAELNETLFNSPSITTLNKHVEVSITPGIYQAASDGYQISAYPVFFNVITIESNVNSIHDDGIIGNFTSVVLEIKVYNK